jgi:hypothetical protein
MVVSGMAILLAGKWLMIAVKLDAMTLIKVKRRTEIVVCAAHYGSDGYFNVM